MPSARNAPKLSGARSAMRSPRQAITQKHSSDQGRADQSESLRQITAKMKSVSGSGR